MVCLCSEGEHTSSWTLGFPPSDRYLSITFSLPWVAAFMNSAVSTCPICPCRNTHAEGQKKRTEIQFLCLLVHIKRRFLKIVAHHRDFHRQPGRVCFPDLLFPFAQRYDIFSFAQVQNLAVCLWGNAALSLLRLKMTETMTMKKTLLEKLGEKGTVGL